MKSSDFRSAFNVIGQAFRLWWGDWSNGVLVSLVAILISLTGLLAGPAVLGMAVVADDLAEGLRTGFSGWWDGFKKYFWVGLLWGGVNLVLIALMAFSLWFYTQWDTPLSPLLAVLLLVIAVFWAYIQLLTPGYLLAQKDKSLGLAWKNSLLTLLASPGFCMVSCGLSLLILVASLATLLPLMIGVGPLLALVSVLAVRDRLALYQSQEKA
jgi:uncharacterized membrane protein YesL